MKENKKKNKGKQEKEKEKKLQNYSLFLQPFELSMYGPQPIIGMQATWVLNLV